MASVERVPVESRQPSQAHRVCQPKLKPSSIRPAQAVSSLVAQSAVRGDHRAASRRPLTIKAASTSPAGPLPPFSSCAKNTASRMPARHSIEGRWSHPPRKHKHSRFLMAYETNILSMEEPAIRGTWLTPPAARAAAKPQPSLPAALQAALAATAALHSSARAFLRHLRTQTDSRPHSLPQVISRGRRRIFLDRCRRPMADHRRPPLTLESHGRSDPGDALSHPFTRTQSK